MLSLSTSWKSLDCASGDAMIKALEQFNITGIELEYRVSESLFRQMRSLLKHSYLKVFSVHNFFPFPSDMHGVRPDGDMFLLSHPNIEERMRAIEWTKRTIEHANDMEARAVVLHCGRVEMDPEKRVLFNHFETGQIHSDEAQTFIKQKRAERNRKKAPYLDALLFSLDRLMPIAGRENILLGIENRFHYHQLPYFFDEFDKIFSEFNGGPIGYWHDMGHARAGEILTLIPEESLLKNYSEHLIGVHIHDAVGLNDHLPPGKGEIAFDRLVSYLKPGTIRVVELKPGTPDRDAAHGIHFLHQMGITS
jgi:sugar phosphate isomerase/epimerase